MRHSGRDRAWSWWRSDKRLMHRWLTLIIIICSEDSDSYRILWYNKVSHSATMSVLQINSHLNPLICSARHNILIHCNNQHTARKAPARIMWSAKCYSDKAQPNKEEPEAVNIPKIFCLRLPPNRCAVSFLTSVHLSLITCSKRCT